MMSVSRKAATLRPPQQPGRRQFAKAALGAASMVAAPGLGLGKLWAAERLVVAQPGGPYETAFGKAFAEPFTKETGIEVVLVPRPFFPSGLVQSQVETKSYQWDVVSLSAFDVEILTRRKMLENLDLPAADLAGIMPSAIRREWLGVDVYATVLAYRQDRLKGGAPTSWADLWDSGTFAGRRSMYNNPIGTLEQALLADGVPLKELYPIDYARAFRKLDKLKSKVNVWWTSGAQSTQLLRDGGADIMAIWNGRAQATIDDGTPATIVWNQGLYTVHGFSIAKGAPKKSLGLEFIRYCADAKRQAAYTPFIASGPTNANAYKYIEPKLADTLPTGPKHVATLLEQNTAWWTDNKEEATSRFNQWLIS
jgi:putative spermidine/putrescine transport system substrate-binding protein